MNRFLLLPLLCLCLFVQALAQGSANDDVSGVLDEGVYTNERYGFTFTVPQGWQPVSEEQLQAIEQRMNTGATDVRPFIVLLRPAPNGEPPDLIFISGARLKPFSGISRNAAMAYFKALPKSKTTRVIRPADSFLLGGMLVAREDFQSASDGREEYMANMAILIRDRLISVQVSSVSAERMEQAVQTASDNTEFEPDWVSRSNKSEPANPEEKPARISEATLLGLLQTKVAAQLPEGLEPSEIKMPISMHVLVSAKGDVQKVWVFEGLSTLAWSAVQAVRQWHFRPYLQDHKPVPVESTITFFFR